MFVSVPWWTVLVGCFLAEGPASDPFLDDPDNASPTVQITTPEDGTWALVGDTLRFTAVAEDPDGLRDVASMSWASTVQGELPGATEVRDAGRLTSTLDVALEPGNHLVVATVTDRGGFTAEASLFVEVATAAPDPEVEITSPDPTERWYTGRTVTMRAEVADERYAALRLTARWTLTPLDGGSPRELFVGPVVGGSDGIGFSQASWLSDVFGEHEVRVVVDNPGGGLADASVVLDFGDPGAFDDDLDGVTPADGDCDDLDADVFPGQDESANGADDDCDGVVDEGTALYDDDGDGFCEADVPCSDPNTQPGDCDDDDPDAAPDLVEVCGDDLDNDCDGVEDTEDAIGCDELFWDEDGDGYGVDPPDMKCLCIPEFAYTAAMAGDCDDDDDDVFPGAMELPNQEDDDCDGVPDNDLDKTDLDGDGYCANPTTCRGGWTPGDCDDTDTFVNPGARERCDTAYDDDCDGDTNDPGALLCDPWWADRDRDGWGDAFDLQCRCDAVPPYDNDGDNLGDCDDIDPSAYPTQSAFFTRPTQGNGDFDFDCSGTITPSRFGPEFKCVVRITGGLCETERNGWVDDVPECGETATWADDCSLGLFTCNPSDTEVLTLGCR